MPNKFNNITIIKIMDNNNHVLVQCGKKNKSINSELPLEFTSDGQNLEDYRIYGNTGGVGDRCNLFNKDNADITTAFPDPSTGQLKIEQSYGDSPKSVIIAVAPNTTYTIQIGKLPLVFTRSAEYTSYPQVGDAGTLLSTTATLESNTSYGVSFTTSATAAYIVWYFSWNATESELQSKLDSMMLSKGNVLKNYKTYDEYQIPVVINGNTISFQIDEPLQFNQSISLLDTNINIPTINGINTLTIATDVKPQNLMIKGNVEYIDSGESIIYTISYYSQDGQTLIRTEKVPKYGNAMDLQNEPTKESTEQYNYTFVGWNMSANQTTATSGVLNNITSDKAVYAAFSETVRTYTVYFYNYDNTLLQTVQNVPYGGSATYTEATPTKVGTSTKEYVFTGWSPSPDSISGDISCVAQYYELTQTITDTWDEIITNAENNTYSTKYSIGDTKCLDLGIEGKVLMEIVAFNSDILASDNTKKAAITWISKQLLDNTHRMNPTIDNNTQGTGAIGGWEYSDMRGYLNSTIKPLIPSNIRSAIKEVTKYSKIYDTSGNAVNNVSTDDEVWIPSAFEIGFSDFETLGTSYTSKFIDNTSRIKRRVGKANLAYHLRSAHVNYGFGFISTDGSRSYGNSHMVIGIALGFCIGTAPDYITDSWATISSKGEAGTAQNYYAIGDCKPIELNGTMGTVTFDHETIYTYILGFNHNSTIEGNGITFGGFKTAAKNGIDIALCDSHLDSIDTTGQKWFNVNHYPGGNAYGHNFGGWKGSDIRYDILGSTNVAPSEYGTTPTTANVGYDATSTCATTPITNTLMSCLPSDLRAVMKPIMKYTDNVGNKSNTEANVTVSIDYLPLLSEYEVVGTRTNANTYEQNKQAQYAYYTNGNSKIKKSNNDTNSSVSWTFRSPNFNGTNDFCRIKTDGTVDTQATGTSIGIAPIFLIGTAPTTYTVTYYSQDGQTVLSTETVEEGHNCIYSTSPTKASDTDFDYSFVGWSTTTNSTTATAGATESIQQNTNLYAAFSKSLKGDTISDSWEEIIANCDNGIYASKYQVGDLKTIDVGTEGPVQMQIVAIDTDLLASDNTKKAPVTWISKQLLNTYKAMHGTSSGYLSDWANCDMRTYLRGTILPMLPSVVQNGIKEVTKYTCKRTSSKTYTTVSTTENIWLPSYREVSNNTSDCETSGVQYNSIFTDNASRFKSKVGNSAYYWWIRSASGYLYSTYSNCFACVGFGGDADYFGMNCPISYGVAIGFCT